MPSVSLMVYLCGFSTATEKGQPCKFNPHTIKFLRRCRWVEARVLEFQFTILSPSKQAKLTLPRQSGQGGLTGTAFKI